MSKLLTGELLARAEGTSRQVRKGREEKCETC